MVPSEEERNSWIDQCDKVLKLKFRKIAEEFIREELKLRIEGELTKKECVKLLKVEISRNPKEYSNFQEFFRLRCKEIETDTKRAYYYINEPIENVRSFTKNNFEGLINQNPPNNENKESGFLNMESKKPYITSAKYIHYSVPKKYFDTEDAKLKETNPQVKETSFKYDHNKNLIILESNIYTDARSLIAHLKEIVSFEIDPFGVYKNNPNPTNHIINICRELFDDTWMMNSPKRMKRLEETNPPSKFVDELFNKNDKAIQKIGNIDMSKCKLPFKEITSNNIVASLLRKDVVIIGFDICTYFKNYPFKIKIKSSPHFSSLSIVRKSKEEAYSEMIELKDKIEVFLHDRFK